MKTLIAAALAALSAGLIHPAAGLAQGINLRVTKSYADRIRLAVPVFLNEGVERPELAAKISNLLLADLTLTGYFLPLDKTEFIRELDESDRRQGKIDLRAWSTLGIEVLVKGTFKVEGNRVTIACRAFSLAQGQQVYGRSYSENLAQWRWIVHTLSDGIVESLTGEKGLARTEIAFVSSQGGERKIHVMEASGGEWRRIDSGPGLALYPAWSPDGESLVYTSYSSGFPWLFIDNLRSGKRRVISSQAGLNALSSIAPDGKWIALTLSKDGNPEIYKARLDGEGMQRLTFSPAVECSPDWSPDGRRIAFVSDRAGTPQIYLMDADGTNLRRLTTRGSHNASPSWSPRGDLIAYSSLIEGKFEICVIDVRTGEVTQLTRNPYRNEEPSWAPDGQHLVYTSRQGGKNHLMVLDVRNPEPVQITHGPDATNAAWSPVLKSRVD